MGKDPWNLGAASEIREADLNNESYNEANAFVHSTLATFLLVLTYYVTVVVHNKTYNPVGPLMVGLVNWALLATGTAVQGRPHEPCPHCCPRRHLERDGRHLDVHHCPHRRCHHRLRRLPVPLPGGQRGCQDCRA